MAAHGSGVCAVGAHFISEGRLPQAMDLGHFSKPGSTALIRMDLQPYAAGACAVGLSIYAKERPPVS